MYPSVTLTLLNDDEVAGEYVFSPPTRFVVGRSDDCDLALPPEPLNQDVSRHHCAFEIEPPLVRVRDLGSLNGTDVNGVEIGRREDITWSGNAREATPSAVELLGQLGPMPLLYWPVLIMLPYDVTFWQREPAPNGFE